MDIRKKIVTSSPDLKNFKAMQDQYNKGKKSAGQLVNMVSGRTEIKIPITGTARAFLGFKIIPEIKGTGGSAIGFTSQLSVTLNNDIIIQNGALLLYTPVNIVNKEYFEYLRPLTGADTLIVSFINPIADTFAVVFQYYYVDHA